MTKGLHDIAKQIRDFFELRDSPNIFLSKKLNLAYLVNSVPEFKRKETSHGVVTQNVWYTAFEGTNVAILGFGAKVAVANETVALRITVDGVVWTASGVALTQGGNDMTGLAVSSIPLADETSQVFTQSAAATTYMVYFYAMACFTGRSVKCELSKSTAAGAATLTSYVFYQQF